MATTPQTFFCIDDDPSMVEIITLLLEAGGHTVHSATTSVDILDTLAATHPDCILIDLMMPEKDGMTLCKEIREDERLANSKIIIISGKNYEFDRKRALEFGANGYITKPLHPETFGDLVMRILNDQIELNFWGVRGTLPVPGEKSIRYGGNTSCVSLEFTKGDFLIFDAGSGIKKLSDHLLASGRSRLDAKVFISHPHWDHINALPFFVPMYMQGNEFEILGASHGDISMRQLISAQMDGVYFPITIKEFGSRVYFRDLSEESFDLDGITVSTMMLNHPGNCLGYKIEYNGKSVCYITDNELYLEDNPLYNAHYVEKLANFVRGTDVLITDTTYTDTEYTTKVGWGHSCISRVVDLADRADVKSLYLFHHDPDQSDDAIDAKLETARDLLDARGSAVECIAPAEGTKVML